MKTEREILDALKVLEETCIENKGNCCNCVLRNGENCCAVLVNSIGDRYECLQEWKLREENRPRLILN